MRRNIVDRSGERFGRLLVMRPIAINPTWFECRCDCGVIVNVRSGSLRDGRTNSCGCLRKERVTKHGGTAKRLPEYFIWKGIKARCFNPNCKSYPNYGGRGITLCNEWADSFKSFIADIGWRPSKSHTVERIANDIGYEPGNVRWATRLEQGSNTRRNTFVEIDGERLTLSQAARRKGIPVDRLSQRLSHGWPLERALRPERMNRWSAR